MDVTDVLRDRMQEPPGLERMTAASALAHGAVIALVLFAPGRWMSRPDEAPKAVMTITLGGGTSGPANTGLTPIGGRPIQTLTPQDNPRRPEPLRPPAAKEPDMVLPKPGSKPVKATPTPVKSAPDEARGKTPTRGAEVMAGSAVAETGARGQGFGLSSSGGDGSGSSLDVANFCCPDYLMLMIDRIRTNWNQQAEVAGQAIVKFTIQRDGRLSDIALEKSSGYTALDLNAQRAVLTTRQLPALPAAFTNPTLTVHLNFQYQR